MTSVFDPVAPWEEAPEVPLGGFRCLPGKIMVEIGPAPQESRGGVLLPQTAAEEMMPDSGTVVAVGEGVGATEGQRCLVLPKHGKSVENYVRNGEKRFGFTRFYGCAGGFSPYLWRGEPHYSAVLVNWWESVFMLEEIEGYQPTGDWVVLRHEIQEKTDGGIIKAESAFVDPRKSCKGEVFLVGPLCKELKPGDRIVYHEGASRHVVGFGKDTVAVREPFVYGIVT